MSEPADILIVDDVPANLQVISRLLKKQGYKPRAVPSGKMAFQVIERKKPDLILLDINMPELNGYQICEQLKRQPETAAIPVIFLSALNELGDKVKAFEVGGVDFITKPFQFQEVLARVETHLHLRQLQLDMNKQNLALQQSLARERELEGLRDNLINMMVHDLRSPLTGILGYLSLLEIKAEQWDQKSQLYLQEAQDNTEVLVEMISQLLDLHRMESGEMPLKRSETCLNTLATQASKNLGSHALKVNFELNLPEDSVVCDIDASLVQRVVTNLLGNAFKFTPSGGRVCLRVCPEGRIEIEDNGPGVPAEDCERIFDKFGQVAARQENKKYSTGLGLAFCRLVMDAHEGRIGVHSTLGSGSTFWIDFNKSA